jgi:hypothetical protein
MGQLKETGRRRKKKKKKRERWTSGRKREGRGSEGVWGLFFLVFFKPLSNLFKLKHFQNSFENFSNHFKAFKTSHHHT